MKMSPLWVWLQAITFAFIVAGAIIAIVKLS